MRVLSIVALLLCSAGLLGQEQGKLVEEYWEVVYVGAARAGHAHSVTRAIQRDGKPLLTTTLETALRIRRFGKVAAMGMAVECEEAPDGKVRGVGLTMRLDQGEIVQFGRVEGDKIVVRVGNDPNPRPLPWQDDVIGQAAQNRLWAGKQLKPGLEVRYKSYEPSLAAPVSYTARVIERAEAVVLEDRGTPEKPKGEQVKKTLWKVVLTPEPVGPQKARLPESVHWLDDDGKTVRTETDIPGLGRTTTLRVSKGLALLEDATPAEMPDLGLTTLVKLSKPIPKAHDRDSIVYRITLKGDEKPHLAFAQDARQKASAPRGDSFELTVTAIRKPADVGLPAPAEEELLKPTAFLDSGDAKIQELAKKITAGEADSWERARKIEKWVHDNMKPTAAVGLAKASQVCAELRGDCRQYGMLAAALCRAAGIPSRTAIGLVYVNDPRQGPFLGFHLWTEVYVRGQWLGLDATLGQGSIGPGHIKVTDSSWKDGEGLAPLLSLMNVLGRLQIEVVSAE